MHHHSNIVIGEKCKVCDNETCSLKGFIPDIEQIILTFLDSKTWMGSIVLFLLKLQFFATLH